MWSCVFAITYYSLLTATTTYYLLLSIHFVGRMWPCVFAITYYVLLLLPTTYYLVFTLVVRCGHASLQLPRVSLPGKCKVERPAATLLLHFSHGTARLVSCVSTLRAILHLSCCVSSVAEDHRHRQHY